MKEELKSTDDSFFIMKWGKFISLIAAIVFGTNIITGFMLESQNADAQAKARHAEEEKDKIYNEARDKRRRDRSVIDAQNYVNTKFLEYEITQLGKKLKECTNEKTSKKAKP